MEENHLGNVLQISFAGYKTVEVKVAADEKEQDIVIVMSGDAFASSFPGSMRAINISANQGMIVQKSAFLAAESGVQLSIAFQKKIGGGFFGGEGFIMQRLSGQGTAFIEIDGYAMEYLLQPGQSMIVDTGYLAAMSETCTIDVQKVPGVKNMLFGGEGIFNTVVTGPGTIILQTMPINQMAAVLRPFFPSNS